jgi:hypothetical protein
VISLLADSTVDRFPQVVSWKYVCTALSREEMLLIRSCKIQMLLRHSWWWGIESWNLEEWRDCNLLNIESGKEACTSIDGKVCGPKCAVDRAGERQTLSMWEVSLPF